MLHASTACEPLHASCNPLPGLCIMLLLLPVLAAPNKAHATLTLVLPCRTGLLAVGLHAPLGGWGVPGPSFWGR